MPSDKATKDLVWLFMAAFESSPFILYLFLFLYLFYFIKLAVTVQKKPSLVLSAIIVLIYCPSIAREEGTILYINITALHTLVDICNAQTVFFFYI